MRAYQYRPVYLETEPMMGSRYLLGVVVATASGWLHVRAPWEHQPSPLRPARVRQWERCRARIGSIQSHNDLAPGEIGPYCTYGRLRRTPVIADPYRFLLAVMS